MIYDKEVWIFINKVMVKKSILNNNSSCTNISQEIKKITATI